MTTLDVRPDALPEPAGPGVPADTPSAGPAPASAPTSAPVTTVSPPAARATSQPAPPSSPDVPAPTRTAAPPAVRTTSVPRAPRRTAPPTDTPVTRRAVLPAPGPAATARTPPGLVPPRTSTRSGPGTGPGIGRRLRRMRIGGSPYPELEDAAAALDAAAGRPVPEPETPLPDPTAQVCRVVRAAVEVLRGERPAAQLARWVTPQVYDQLLERGRLMREARGKQPPRPKAHPATVRRVRMVRLGAASAEATVILHDEGRVRAAAVRLEGRRGVWRVAVLEIG